MNIKQLLICFFAMGIFSRCGERLELIDGFPPPQEFNENSTSPNLSDLEIRKPYDFKEFEKILVESKNLNKPILIDFSGYASVNCRKMESNTWLAPEVFTILKEEFIIISLYVDNRWDIGSGNRDQMILDEDGNAVHKEIPKTDSLTYTSWLDYQQKRYKGVTQPMYDIVNWKNISIANQTVNYNTHKIPRFFAKWLSDGLTNYKNQHHD